MAVSDVTPRPLAASAAGELNQGDPSGPRASGASACPAGMVHVRFDYCPELTRRCTKKEYDKPNRITICNRFAHERPECHAPRAALSFCIDEYEYPNRKGEKPKVMPNFFEASALCAAEHKRLCFESEWVTACEGPEEKAFPVRL